MENLRTEMATRSIADLTGLYNQAIDDLELAVKPVGKAQNKDAAFKRVEKLMADHNLVLDYDSFSDTYVLAKAEGTPEPTAEEDAAAAFMAQPEGTAEYAFNAGTNSAGEDAATGQPTEAAQDGADSAGTAAAPAPTADASDDAKPAKPAKAKKAKKAKKARKATASKATGAKRGPGAGFDS